MDGVGLVLFCIVPHLHFLDCYPFKAAASFQSKFDQSRAVAIDPGGGGGLRCLVCWHANMLMWFHVSVHAHIYKICSQSCTQTCLQACMLVRMIVIENTCMIPGYTVLTYMSHLKLHNVIILCLARNSLGAKIMLKCFWKKTAFDTKGWSEPYLES
jgi:hypothetical protein